MGTFLLLLSDSLAQGIGLPAQLGDTISRVFDNVGRSARYERLVVQPRLRSR
jgi:hypothetical protein